MKQKPIIAVSRCLLGENVRYNGETKSVPTLIAQLEAYFRIIGVCPEVEAGLSVPRPPVKLVHLHNQTYAKGVADPQLDITEQLMQFAQEFIKHTQNISGLVLKARSPSCGVGSTPIENLTTTGDGLFAAFMQDRFPILPITDEAGLQQIENREVYIARVKSYAMRRV